MNSSLTYDRLNAIELLLLKMIYSGLRSFRGIFSYFVDGYLLMSFFLVEKSIGYECLFFFKGLSSILGTVIYSLNNFIFFN